MIDELSFQYSKAIAVTFSFALVGFGQWYFPLVKAKGEILRNWRTNFPLAGVNLLVGGLICGACVCMVARYFETHQLGIMNQLGIPYLLRVVLSVFLLDLTAYTWHRANHRLPILWRFHAIHHSDEVYDASTAIRFHPGEVLLSLGIRLVVVALLGLPVTGLLVFEICYAFFNTFEHGNLRLPKRFSLGFGLVFVTPALHRIHHSSRAEDFNKNFATIFSFWDRIFGSLQQETQNTTEVKVGLPGRPLSYAFNSWQLLLQPFRRVEL